MNTTNLVYSKEGKWYVKFKLYGKTLNQEFNNYWDADDFANNLDAKQKARMLARMIQKNNEVEQGASVEVTDRRVFDEKASVVS